MGRLSNLFPTAGAVDAALKRANKAEIDIENISGEMNDKIDYSDFRTSINNLQEQINEIAQTHETGDVATEVIQARVDANGSVYPTLKERVDINDASIHSEFKNLADVSLWSQGGIKPNDGWSYDATNRISNYTFYNADRDSVITIIPKSGMQLAYHLYSYGNGYSESHFLDSGWISDAQTVRVPQNCSVRFCCRNSNNDDLSPSDIAGNVINLSENRNIVQYGRCFTQYSSDVILYTDDVTGDEMLKVKLCQDIQLVYNNTKVTLNNAEAVVDRSLGIIFWLVYDADSHTFSLMPNTRFDKYTAKGTLVIFGWCHWQYPRPVIFGEELNESNSYADYLAPLILGGASNCVRFDSTAKTITFPNDTLVISYNQNGSGWNRYYNGLTTAKANNVCYWGDVTSSAIKIYLDKQNDTLIAVDYHDGIPSNTTINQHSSYRADRYALVCSFRTNGAVSINAPYMWDDKPLGMDLGEDVHRQFIDAANVDLWSQGGIKPNDGWSYEATNRISNYTFYNVNPNSVIVIAPKEGMQIAYHLYSYDANHGEHHEYDSGWISEQRIIRVDENYSVRFCCRYANDADLSPSDITGNIINVSVEGFVKYGRCFALYSSDVILYTDPVDGEMLKVKLCKDISLVFDDQKISLNNLEATISRSLGAVFWLAYDTDKTEFFLIPNQRFSKILQSGTIVVFGWCHWQYPRPVIFGAELNTQNPYAEYLAPMILGATQSFVSFDSETKTISFPNDTLIVNYNQIGSGWQRYYNQLTTAKGNTTCYWGNVASSAVKVYLDKAQDVLVAVNYHDDISSATTTNQYSQYRTDRYALVCAFRTNGQVSINAPYKWDGKPFGMDLGEADSPFAMVKTANHRGYSTVAPENTLPAFRLSKKMGYAYVETDVSLTSDGIPVLLHDDTINRTARNADGTEIESEINISDITYDELLEYDFGIWKSTAYTDTKIPTFEQFISQCRNLNLRPYIELKTSGYTQNDILNLINIVKKYGMSNYVTWISFQITYLNYVKDADDSARLGYLMDDVTSAKLAGAVALKTERNEVFIDCKYSTLTSTIVNSIINSNLGLEAWTINNAEALRSANPYITGITSDVLIASQVLAE